MDFEEKHAPVAFSDLVFAEQSARYICETYVLHKPYKHLMLWGEPGTAKTATARVILQERYRAAGYEGRPVEFNGADITKETLEKELYGNLNYLSFQTGDPLVLINEIDEMARDLQAKFRSWMDDWPMMKFVATTNEKPGIKGVRQKIMSSLVSRFQCVELKPPSLNDWLPRAQAIFAAEGHAVSTQDLKLLLGTYSGDFRDMLPIMEAAINQMPTKIPAPTKVKPALQVVSSKKSK